MKRWLAIGAGVLVVLVLAIWGAAAFMVKPEALRGIVVERMSLASLVNARVASVMAPLNHIHGSRAVSRKTM